MSDMYLVITKLAAKIWEWKVGKKVKEVRSSLVADSSRSRLWRENGQSVRDELGGLLDNTVK